MGYLRLIVVFFVITRPNKSQIVEKIGSFKKYFWPLDGIKTLFWEFHDLSQACFSQEKRFHQIEQTLTGEFSN